MEHYIKSEMKHWVYFERISTNGGIKQIIEASLIFCNCLIWWINLVIDSFIDGVKLGTKGREYDNMDVVIRTCQL